MDTDKLKGLYITVARLQTIKTIVKGTDDTSGKIGRNSSPSSVMDTRGWKPVSDVAKKNKPIIKYKRNGWPDTS